MRIIFFGSDDFAALHLELLLKSNHQVICCVTGPDRPQGRGMKMGISPIKEMALAHQIPCLQPISLKTADMVASLKSYQADIFVVVAYGRLLTQEVLDIPKMFCINVHGSLLPKYRGAAPVNWAILNGDKETGVTIQRMALSLDAGDIIDQEHMNIGADENAAQLRQRMAHVGAQLLIKVLDGPLNRFVPQDERLMTYASKLTKEMGKIDWTKTAQTILNQIRGLQPWPGAYTFYQDKMLKVMQAGPSSESVAACTPGRVIKMDKLGFHVACGDQAILIKEVQPQAGKVMPAPSFGAGYKIGTDTTFC